MLKIHELFLRSFVLIFIAILFCVVIGSYLWLKSFYISNIERNLKQNIDSFYIALDSLEDIDAKVAKLKRETSLRITIIDKDGVVIAESDEDKYNMNNHLNREEIANIDHNGTATVTRKSETTNKEMLNVVKKINIANQAIYVRMGDYLKPLRAEFIQLTIKISLVFAIFLILIFLAIYYIGRNLQNQTNVILNFLEKFSQKEVLDKKDLKILNFKYTYEFQKISELLKVVMKRLRKREKLKSKYTASLKLANTQKDEIIGAISHEFKNPIAVILGYSETILEDKALPLDTKELFLKKIQNNANRLTELIDRLRFALSYEYEKQDLFFKPCSLNKICLNIIGDLKQKYKNRDIVIKGDEVVLKIDEPLLGIAIENLIENALKYSYDEVIIEISNKSLSVIDKGVGIDKKDLEKITKKFYRVSNNDWNNSLGLGLFIVEKIVKMHGFKLEIQSQPKDGSRFMIIFE